VVLLWVYYSAQILFFGAELTQVYAGRVQESSGAVTKLLWAGLTVGSLTTVGLARRTSAAIWPALLHEPPPTSKAC
jgi:hypothetical protein